MTVPVRRAVALLAGWMALLLLAWTGVWVVRGWLVGAWPALASGGPSLAFWEMAKLAVWVAPVVILLRREPDGLRLPGLRTARGLGVGVLVSIGWLGAVAAQAALTGQWPAPAQAAWALAGACIFSPVFEELLLRGFALKLLQRRGASFALAGPFTALLFLALHGPGWLFTRSLDAALAYDAGAILVFGLAAAALAWRVPTLWAPIVLHATNNAWSAGVFARGASWLAGP